ncbi:hypothetical protein TNCV_3284921 [Trichonephila clavipes]|nr:hypothetical protein TNCV_3284921 [Trichonephila clavipes]
MFTQFIIGKQLEADNADTYVQGKVNLWPPFGQAGKEETDLVPMLVSNFKVHSMRVTRNQWPNCDLDFIQQKRFCAMCLSLKA